MSDHIAGAGKKIEPCKRCGKRPRGKMASWAAEKYAPYCSYHCQEWARVEDAYKTLKAIKP